MMHALNNKMSLPLLLTLFFIKIDAINSIPQCSQNSLSKENFVCKNVQHTKDLSDLIHKDYIQLKIINEDFKQLEWEEIPEELANLESVDVSQAGKLILSQNGFVSLPNLKNLNVSGGAIESLENSHFNSDNKLEILDASWNLLQNLNFFIGNKFQSLEVGNFSHNEIHSMNSDGDLPKLKILHLDFNELKDISLRGLTNLNFLTISDNLIEKLTPNSFKNLTAMQELIITSSPLRQIDDYTFDSMKELKNLNLSSNSLEQVSAEVFAGLNRLIQLDLNSNNLRELAHLQFQHLVKLQYLDISRNSLQFLNSTNFNNLENLRKLLIYENDIETIKSNTFSRLNLLDTLDLSYNAIGHLDADVFGSYTLPRLRKLMLKSNRLKSLHPLAFSSLPYMQYLSLGFNELANLDVRMFAPMRRLEKLHLGNNLIETISSDVLETFTDVTELLLDNNSLTFLSNSNATFERLEKVTLEGNPWQCPCWDEMTEWLEKRGVSYVRPQSPYFKGQKPLCVVTPVNFCVKNLALVKKHKIQEIYYSG